MEKQKNSRLLVRLSSQKTEVSENEIETPTQNWTNRYCNLAFWRAQGWPPS